jgi:RNA polymerase primary sigma factor|tara:strand:- start:981 stop:1784 length:804 start_codon:yes stop_codon:yes gene_type:complete
MQNTNFLNTEEIQFYLKDIKKLPVSDKQRLTLIVKGLQKTNISSKEREDLLKQLVLGNLRFVISVAKNFQNQGLDLPDLISEGNIGLIKAAEQFDPKRKIKFISYAVWWIRQAIMSSLNDNSRTIRIPSNIIQEQQKLKKLFFDEYENPEKLLEIPTLSIPKCVNLSTPINDEGDELIDIIVNHDSFSPESYVINQDETKEQVKKLLGLLNEKERIIITKYFGLDGVECNLEDLGEQFGCTKERIRQLKEKAMKKLRNESFTLLNYL